MLTLIRVLAEGGCRFADALPWGLMDREKWHLFQGNNKDNFGEEEKKKQNFPLGGTGEQA